MKKSHSDNYPGHATNQRRFIKEQFNLHFINSHICLYQQSVIKIRHDSDMADMFWSSNSTLPLSARGLYNTRETMFLTIPLCSGEKISSSFSMSQNLTLYACVAVMQLIMFVWATHVTKLSALLIQELVFKACMEVINKEEATRKSGHFHLLNTTIAI